MLKKLLLLLIVIPLFSSDSFAGDTVRISFEKRLMQRQYFTSFAFGMGVCYGNNSSLDDFIASQLSGYYNLPEANRLSDFRTGIEFFGSAEKQLNRIISAKIDYSYFIKSNNLNLSQYASYDFTYRNHQILFIINYLIPLEYAFLKIGAGTGILFSDFTYKNYGAEYNFSSTGLGAKLEATLNLQFGNGFAGYLNGYFTRSFQGDLKQKGGGSLPNPVNPSSYNLSSLGFGMRLGVEIFIF